ncbi:hypothetical protein [Maribacter sp. 2304DJ31-5]|uniref:hypothetical protein n=1 Tax=Maribacter sp. 2304DJ31-5 TaxID=3386273 RepID=UPI0039BC5E26
MKKLTFFIMLASLSSWSQTESFYSTSALNGNGFRFWNGNNNYKIHMGNSEFYKYGPVQDFSIKTNMSAGTPNRGWTWGVNGQVPIAALNSVGNFQIAGSFYAMNRIGIGIDSPNSILHVKSQTGQTESLARFQVEDAPTDYFQIVNATGAGGQFIPAIKGHRESDNRYSVQFMGQTNDSNDTGNNALVNFDARRATGPIQNRPLFVWTSFSNKYMTMLANGGLGIGTTNPLSKLDVRGGITSSYDDNRRLSFFNSGDGNGYLSFTGGSPSSRIGFQIDGSSKLSIYNNGSVSIATGSTGTHKLAVGGSIGAREIKVEVGTWSDFVFFKDYNLPSLKEVENHIKEKGHLKDIPSAEEVEENGINLGEMNAKLLQKIEELMLYTIQQQKEIEAIKIQNMILQEGIKTFKK